MELATLRIPFSSVVGSGPHIVKVIVPFEQPVAKAAVALSGYTASYSSGDHELHALTVKVEATILPGPIEEHDIGSVWEVQVLGTLGLRDDSGNWDDPYEGEIVAVLMTEL